MNKKDISVIVESFTKEELPDVVMNISSFDALLFQTPYIERIVRSSDAYQVWREYNKQHEKATIDIIDNLDVRDYSKLGIEQHHYPHTLFDIVQYVGRKLLDDNESTNPYEIAKIVLQEHLLGNIGFVPLLITDHQKQHCDLLDIEEDKIKGNYKEFERKYI